MDDALLKTPLHAMHLRLGGKMVNFAGYDMPVQYDGFGVLKEHLHTRSAAGLFDVSHMGQAILSGDVNRLEKIVPSDIRALGIGKTRYTVMLNDHGGIVDDLMVTRIDDQTLYLVVNAACKDKDFSFIRAHIPAKLDELPDRALLALQGPLAADVLQQHFPQTADMTFMTFLRVGDYFITRSGYTGEDGFEISVPAAESATFAEKLLADARVKFIGLGARDSLRLEAGLCLYGHDINEQTSPIEANLKWVIQKRRREAGGFNGADRILAEMAKGAEKIRVGIKPEGKAPVREGAELHADDGSKIGVVTSGGFGPSVDAPVAMGYVDAAYAVTGTKINALVRGTPRASVVCELPFTPHKYRK